MHYLKKIGGLIINEMDRIPNIGEQLDLFGYKIEIISASYLLIDTVKLTYIEPEDDDNEEN